MNIPSPYAAVITLLISYEGVNFSLECTISPEYGEGPQLSQFGDDDCGDVEMKFTGCVRVSDGYDALMDKAKAIRDYAKTVIAKFPVDKCNALCEQIDRAFECFQTEIYQWEGLE